MASQSAPTHCEGTHEETPVADAARAPALHQLHRCRASRVRKVSGLIDAERRKLLESAGAEIGTVNDALFTARIRPVDVAHVAALDFVLSLQLSQTREAQ